MAKPVSISQTYPRLAVFSEENFRGRRRVYRGNLGISDVDAILTGIESLRFFFSTNPNATLVLFNRSRFRDRFVVLRGIAAFANWMTFCAEEMWNPSSHPISA